MHHLRSRVHNGDVNGKDISITGYIVKTNLAEAPECAVHKTGKGDKDDCKAAIPAFWIADEKGDDKNAIKVMGWASNYSQIFDAIQKYSVKSNTEAVKDEFWGAEFPTRSPTRAPRSPSRATLPFVHQVDERRRDRPLARDHDLREDDLRRAARRTGHPPRDAGRQGSDGAKRRRSNAHPLSRNASSREKATTAQAGWPFCLGLAAGSGERAKREGAQKPSRPSPLSGGGLVGQTGWREPSRHPASVFSLTYRREPSYGPRSPAG